MADPEEFSLLRPILCTMGLSDKGWSPNPDRYVGVAEANGDAVDFREQAEELTEEREQRITRNAAKIQER
jgi:hypothetical protein